MSSGRREYLWGLFWGEWTVSGKIDALAEQIAALDPSEQVALLDRVAELNSRRDLEALSQKYRERRAAEGKLGQTAEQVMAQLEHIREAIAANDYQP
jgi:hypothetical protein